MPDRILTSASAAAVLAALVFFAGEGAAQAARCPLGEIYRPSRGVCVAKEKAIQAGIYHGSVHARAAAAAPRADDVATATLEPAPSVKPASYRTASADPVAPLPKPRPQALAAIERRAPAASALDEAALAFTNDGKPRADAGRSLIQTKPVQATTVSYARPAPSPFGSLVALEPMP